jgi:hypothetical protein
VIGSLRGKILDKKPPEILIEVGGVGYEVLMPISAFCKIGEIGSDLFVYTSFVVREDAQMLFGFLTSDEKILSYFPIYGKLPCGVGGPCVHRFGGNTPRDPGFHAV